MIQAEDLQQKIAGETTELQLLEGRRQGLDREREAIRQGRVVLRTQAVPAFAPTSDKKIPAAAAGAVGGFALSFGLFFLIGTLDQKTFGVRQLQDQRNSLRVLGVMPNMDEVEQESDTVALATDCVHRIRGRIESRRGNRAGFALMVSSPFQGDGKTTLAVSLGWSYAESGYKTLLLDADFIGRAMTHQFGHLKDNGLREIIRDGEIRDEIYELGHPNLSLLGVGFDRRISAANLSPRIMKDVIDSLRDRFDLIIIDSGPITASIEAMSVASAADGVVLALRRGRSRARLLECVEDIRSVGSDYIGVVLNYAERSDCLKYGSTSRMSASVQSALEAGDEAALSEQANPMLGGLESRDD
jgi:succinoglycan biosynthesis transport protein ExoP